ncbi:MAG TPA: PadR family transcriptional regulator [Stenotrophomonas sp.]|nr:PadR family transcriptional regulator [Stenotrophomonas sp.]
MHTLFPRFARHGGPHGHPAHAHTHAESTGRGHHPSHDRFFHSDTCATHASRRGGHGTDGFDGPRGGPGGGDFDGLRGGRGRGGARPLGHGDLRHLMLHLIAEQPRHGYELIRLIEALFHGAYSPSPGAIYPTLSQLEDMGLIAATAEDGRKRYAITAEGRAHMAQAHEEIEAARLRTQRSARELAKAQIPPPVREAMGRIKRGVLTRHGHWSEEEIARVAALLNQAADGMEDPA